MLRGHKGVAVLVEDIGEVFFVTGHRPHLLSSPRVRARRQVGGPVVLHMFFASTRGTRHSRLSVGGVSVNLRGCLGAL